MDSRDLTVELTDRVRQACATHAPLRIVGGGTKQFLGLEIDAQALDVSAHSGIVSYDPAELVVTARGGTRLRDLRVALAERGQRLPFEPPEFGEAATIGGTVACGLSGPARAYSGPLRDFVLGVRVLTGDGRVLRFGGEVMKNVAGYDVARAMAGAFGTLGVLLDVSLKVLPRPPATRSLSLALDQVGALAELERLSRTALPLTASSWTGGSLVLRFEGSERTLDAVQARVGGEVVASGDDHWKSIREQTHGFFRGAARLWRLHVSALAPPLGLPGDPLIEWNGTQRWYALHANVAIHSRAPLDSSTAFDVASAAGGYATLFRGARSGDEVFARPAEPLMRLHRSLKQVFDPAGVLNPGHMYRDV